MTEVSEKSLVGSWVVEVSKSKLWVVNMHFLL
jgi:hypothetical protein